MNRFIAYYRVSTKQQGESGLGLEAQQQAVARFLGASDVVVDQPYIEVESGRKKERPELLRALSRCRAMGAKLIVAKVDRLTRSVAFLETVRTSGVEVVFCDLPSIRGAVGDFMLQQMASVAQLEAGLISERTKAALAARVEQKGKWDRNAQHHLVPGAGQRQAAEARRLRADRTAHDLRPLIEDIQKEGVGSLRGIAKELTERGIRSPSGGKWHPTAVKRVLERFAAT